MRSTVFNNVANIGVPPQWIATLPAKQLAWVQKKKPKKPFHYTGLQNKYEDMGVSRGLIDKSRIYPEYYILLFILS